MSLKYEPSSEPLHISTLVSPAGGGDLRVERSRGGDRSRFFFFFTLVTGPRRSLSLKLTDSRVYEPQIRARLGTTAHFDLSVERRRSGRRSRDHLSVWIHSTDLCLCVRRRGASESKLKISSRNTNNL